MSTRTGRPAATSVSSARSGKRFPMSLGRLLPFLAPAPLVGGQAVMEGVMMRNGDVYALAVRTADGNISVENRPWFSLTRSELLKKPFLRGFPTLIETLVNGIKALNLSAERSTEGTGEELKDWQLVLTLIVSLLFAVGLFVVVPHLLSIIMNWIGLGGDVEGFSFHIWDGLFKFLIFIGYIVGIAFLPDIRRVFCYHGAEHKTIHAYESGDTVTPESAILRHDLPAVRHVHRHPAAYGPRPAAAPCLDAGQRRGQASFHYRLQAAAYGSHQCPVL